MLTSLSLFIFLGFYALYVASNRANHTATLGITLWMKNHLKLTQLLACVLLIMAFVLLMYDFGILSGILIGFTALMLIAGGVVILTPLKLFNFKVVSIVFLISILLEVFI